MLSYLTNDDLKRINPNGIREVIKILEKNFQHANSVEKEEIKKEIQELKNSWIIRI